VIVVSGNDYGTRIVWPVRHDRAAGADAADANARAPPAAGGKTDVAVAVGLLRRQRAADDGTGCKTAEDADGVAIPTATEMGPEAAAEMADGEAAKALRGGSRWEGYSGGRDSGEPRDDHLGNRVKHDPPPIAGARWAFVEAVADRFRPRSTRSLSAAVPGRIDLGQM